METVGELVGYGWFKTVHGAWKPDHEKQIRGRPIRLKAGLGVVSSFLGSTFAWKKPFSRRLTL